nr:unnamed protein product [Digitaria exilis]
MADKHTPRGSSRWQHGPTKHPDKKEKSSSQGASVARHPTARSTSNRPHLLRHIREPTPAVPSFNCRLLRPPPHAVAVP